MNTDTFINRYPKLYHMAQLGSWPSIKCHGLLSTSATLDRLGIVGAERLALESRHRAESIELRGPEGEVVVLRDQKPMPERQLQRALRPGTTTSDWYRIINSRVFFWATEDRLMTLLGGREYRDSEHDVLTVDTSRLVGDYGHLAELSHMNSGNVFPYPHIRGPELFVPIGAYPTGAKGGPLKEVAEVTFPGKISNMSKYVEEVRRMRGPNVLEILPL